MQKEIDSVNKLLFDTGIDKAVRLLDIGSGLGVASENCKIDVRYVVLLDYSITMLKNSASGRNSSFPVLADVLDAPFKSSSFDLILCVGVSEYIKNIHRLLLQITHLLKPGGYCVFTTSPDNLYTQLRMISGHRLYPVPSANFLMWVKQTKLIPVVKEKTTMQNQFILQKPVDH